MGWWWSNQSSDKEVTPKETSQQHPLPVSERELPSPEPVPVPEFPHPQPPRRPLTRDEQSDRELVSWLKELQSEAVEKKPSTSKSQPFTNSPPEDITPDSLYPTEISCRSAFDYAFFCQSFGGQFVNIYRYGTFRSCSNHWQDFWLCMRTRNWDDKDRKKAIQDHYRQKAIKYKTGSSSEDVWEVRTEPARDAFQGNLEELERQIEEWKKANPNAGAPWEKSIPDLAIPVKLQIIPEGTVPLHLISKGTVSNPSWFPGYDPAFYSSEVHMDDLSLPQPPPMPLQGTKSARATVKLSSKISPFIQKLQQAPDGYWFEPEEPPEDIDVMHPVSGPKIASSEAHRLLDEAVGTVSCLGLFADQKGRAEERAGKARKILKCEWKSKTYNGNEISGEIKKRWISHGNQQINEMVQKENTALENAQLDDNYTPELSDESADEAMWL